MINHSDIFKCSNYINTTACFQRYKFTFKQSPNDNKWLELGYNLYNKLKNLNKVLQSRKFIG